MKHPNFRIVNISSTINILGHMKFPTANFSIRCFVTTKLPDSWYFFFSFANTKINHSLNVLGFPCLLLHWHILCRKLWAFSIEKVDWDFTNMSLISSKIWSHLFLLQWVYIVFQILRQCLLIIIISDHKILYRLGPHMAGKQWQDI